MEARREQMESVFKRALELTGDEEVSYSAAMADAEEELGISLTRHEADSVMRWFWAEATR
jgi:hypothetical protein